MLYQILLLLLKALGELKQRGYGRKYSIPVWYQHIFTPGWCSYDTEGISVVHERISCLLPFG